MTGITIAIATHNRAGELNRTLRGLLRLNGGGDHEILIVANCCTDQTVEVVRKLAPGFSGRLRCVAEDRPGLSRARNRAVAEANYPVIAFLDDDVDVDPNWLSALSTAYAGGGYAAIGGRAHLVYPSQRPIWLGERDEGYLTKVELGPTARVAQPDELYGVNLSFRIDWIKRVGGFRTDLGRVGKSLIGDEEAELLDRIVRAGGALLYEPAAVVGHRVAAGRLRRKWFWKRCFEGHVGSARILSADQVSAKALVRAAWRTGRAALETVAALLGDGPASEPLFHQTTILASRAGIWVGLIGRIGCKREIQNRTVVGARGSEAGA